MNTLLKYAVAVRVSHKIESTGLSHESMEALSRQHTSSGELRKITNHSNEPTPQLQIKERLRKKHTFSVSPSKLSAKKYVNML